MSNLFYISQGGNFLTSLGNFKIFGGCDSLPHYTLPAMQKQRIRFLGDTMGLAPFPLRFKQTLTALFGEEDVPASKFGLSSLSQLHPRVGLKLWRGKPYLQGKVIISNLFNHTQTPFEDGWSVKKTQALDFRGRQLTYDSHNGTDFSIPVGTTVCTAAAGTVVAVMSQFNRGGLKVFIDHGEGLMTSYGHLAVSMVKPGDVLSRGQVIAISGYSGLDAAVTFPFGVPHVHFNVWHNCVPVDPFEHGQEVSMWNNGAIPAPASDTASTYVPVVYNHTLVTQVINSCKTETVRQRLLAITDAVEQAAHTIIEMNYYPTRFDKHYNLYDKSYTRRARLDLPFKASDFSEVVFLDDVVKLRTSARKHMA